MKSHHASSAETLFLFPKKSRKDDSAIDVRKVKILIFIPSSAGREKLVLKSCDLFRGNEFNIFAFRTISVLRGRIPPPKQVPHTIVLEIKPKKRKRRYANGKKSGKTSSCTERVATAGSLEHENSFPSSEDPLFVLGPKYTHFHTQRQTVSLFVPSAKNLLRMKKQNSCSVPPSSPKSTCLPPTPLQLDTKNPILSPRQSPPRFSCCFLFCCVVLGKTCFAALSPSSAQLPPAHCVGFRDPHSFSIVLGGGEVGFLVMHCFS